MSSERAWGLSLVFDGGADGTSNNATLRLAVDPDRIRSLIGYPYLIRCNRESWQTPVKLPTFQHSNRLSLWWHTLLYLLFTVPNITMADLTSQVLDALSESEGPILSADAFPSIPSATIKSALDRLGSREMVVYKKIDREEAVLTPEAEGIAANGSHEAKVFDAVRKAVEGLKIADLPVRGRNCMPARLDDLLTAVS